MVCPQAALSGLCFVWSQGGPQTTRTKVRLQGWWQKQTSSHPHCPMPLVDLCPLHCFSRLSWPADQPLSPPHHLPAQASISPLDCWVSLPCQSPASSLPLCPEARRALSKLQIWLPTFVTSGPPSHPSFMGALSFWTLSNPSHIYSPHNLTLLLSGLPLAPQ